MRRGVFFYIFVVFLLSCIVGTSVFSTYEFFLSEGPLEERKEVLIEKGMPLRKIAFHLKNQGIIDSPSIFTLGVRANGKAGDLKAGEYSIPARASAKMVMDILTGGQTFIRKITIPEGLTSYQIVALLDKANGLTGTVEELPENGTLLPETYYYSTGDTKQQLIVRMQNAMKRTIDELWDKRVRDLPISTPKEAIILASIVEKETSILAEQNHVAAVFLNRLVKKMRLQSDPTVIFALSKGTGIYKKKLWSNDLKKPHPFNTYYIYGLPPEAIANPGKNAIEAVLQPFQTDDLYFVADGTGGHVFAATYAEHQRNVRAWRELKKDRTVRRQMRRVKRIQNIPEVPEMPENRLIHDAEKKGVVELADDKEAAGKLDSVPSPEAVSATASIDTPTSATDSKTEPENEKAVLKNQEKSISPKPDFVPKVKPNFQQKDVVEPNKKALPKAA